MEDPIEVVDAKITLRYKLCFLHDVKNKLDEPRNFKRKQMFEETIFGKWLDFPKFSNDNLLLNYILHHQVSANPSDYCPPIAFCISGNRFEFGRKEFCLVTGFRFGQLRPERHVGLGSSEFIDRILPVKVSHGIKKVKGDELMPFFTEDEKWFAISDDDSIRICLLLVATIVFMGHRTRSYIPDNIVELVEDLSAWDNYPWGEYFWRVFYERILNVVPKKNVRDAKKIEENVIEPAPKKRKSRNGSVHESNPAPETPKKMIAYNLCGFAWALKIFILEIFPTSNKWWKKDPEIVPRCLCWSIAEKFTKNDLPLLFAEHTKPQLMSFCPTEYECLQTWFLDSMDFFNFLDESDQRKRENSLQLQLLEQVDSADIIGLEENECTLSKDQALCEFEAIQSTVGSIDSRKEDTSSYVLLQELVVVKERMRLLEQAIKVSYSDASEGSVKQNSSKSDCAVSAVVHEENAKETQTLVSQPTVFTPTTYNMTPLFEASKELVDETQNDWPVPNLNNPFSEYDVDDRVTMSPGAKDFRMVNEHSDGLSTQVHNMCVNETTGHENFDDQSTHQPVQDDVDDHVTMSPGAKDFGMDNEHCDGLSSQVHNMCVNETTGHENFDDQPTHQPVQDEVDYPVKMSPGAKEFGRDNEESDGLSNLVDSMSINETNVHASVDDQSNHEPVQVGNTLALEDESVNMNIPRTADKIFGRLKRFTKKGKFRRPPYTLLPSTTPITKKRKSKRLQMAVLPMPSLDDDCQIILPKYWLKDELRQVRTRQEKKGDNRNTNLDEDFPDFELMAVEPWIEDLSRAPESNKSKVTMPAYLDQILKMPNDTGHVFPWSRKGYGLEREDWLTLLGCCRKGWMSDKHLDIWCDLMWHFRKVDADWAIAGPYFCPFVMRGDVPFWPANGIKYPVPWTKVNRVFIPINEPDTHYCLGVLHIMTGVITLYDSLRIQGPEKRDWWKTMRQSFADIVPTYLDNCGVFNTKSICPKTYKISFEYEEKVPVQAKDSGDCAIWVCIMLHRLCNNLPISTEDDPAQVALAYREHMTDYLWKYRIPDRLKSIDECV